MCFGIEYWIEDEPKKKSLIYKIIDNWTWCKVTKEEHDKLRNKIERLRDKLQDEYIKRKRVERKLAKCQSYLRTLKGQE